MMRTVQCPKCHVELTIPEEAGGRRLRCPKCAERFYPSGRPASSPGSTSSPASSVLAQSIDAPRPVKRATVPPSSGMHRSTRGSDGEFRASSGDLRDFLDIPLADEGPASRPPSHMADAAALFRDEPSPSRTHRIKAEARLQARRCSSCQSIVPAGMSLCERCGLDLDTGQRYEVEEEYADEPTPEPTVPGPPTMVLMIGLVVLVSSMVLAILSLFLLEGIGQVCLTPVCLFGGYAAVQFLRGKSSNLLVVALMLGGAVNIVTLIILPLALPEDVPVGIVIAQDGSPPPTARPAEGTDADEAARVKAEIPLAERIDNSKLTLGIVILIVDAAMLLCLATPGVRQHCERKRRSRDEGFIIT